MADTTESISVTLVFSLGPHLIKSSFAECGSLSHLEFSVQW